MALTPVPSINLDNLPQEAVSLIETLAHRAKEADRLEEEENRLLREMLRLERLKNMVPRVRSSARSRLSSWSLNPEFTRRRSRRNRKSPPGARSS